MKPFFTCVDTLGYDDSHDFYEPTIYEVWGLVPREHIKGECVADLESLSRLNSSPCSAVHFVRRTKGRVFATLESNDGDKNILSLLHTTNNLGREGNTSNIQRMWGEDIRSIFRSTPQFPPFAEYYNSIDRLLHDLEMQFRRIDTGNISEKFWPHQGFMLSGERHADYPGYLPRVPEFPELMM